MELTHYYKHDISKPINIEKFFDDDEEFSMLGNFIAEYFYQQAMDKFNVNTSYLEQIVPDIHWLPSNITEYIADYESDFNDFDRRFLVDVFYNILDYLTSESFSNLLNSFSASNAKSVVNSASSIIAIDNITDSHIQTINTEFPGFNNKLISFFEKITFHPHSSRLKGNAFLSISNKNNNFAFEVREVYLKLLFDKGNLTTSFDELMKMLKFNKIDEENKNQIANIISSHINYPLTCLFEGIEKINDDTLIFSNYDHSIKKLTLSKETMEIAIQAFHSLKTLSQSDESSILTKLSFININVIYPKIKNGCFFITPPSYTLEFHTIKENESLKKALMDLFIDKPIDMLLRLNLLAKYYKNNSFDRVEKLFSDQISEVFDEQFIKQLREFELANIVENKNFNHVKLKI